MSVKDIDPVEVKEAIERGQLEVCIHISNFLFDSILRVYLKDTFTGEMVLLTEYRKEK